jgi:hypothetical protein
MSVASISATKRFDFGGTDLARFFCHRGPQDKGQSDARICAGRTLGGTCDVSGLVGWIFKRNCGKMTVG